MLFTIMNGVFFTDRQAMFSQRVIISYFQKLKNKYYFSFLINLNFFKTFVQISKKPEKLGIIGYYCYPVIIKFGRL